ncbi:MAG: multicopper oxidase domain-containing protein, partial [Actinomycetota bacterium]
HAVGITDRVYEPETMTVNVGDRITWTNHDKEDHSVVGGPMEEGKTDMPPDGTFSYAFTEPGEINYTCHFHPEMTGTIDVQGEPGQGSPPESRPEPGPQPQPEPRPEPGPLDQLLHAITGIIGGSSPPAPGVEARAAPASAPPPAPTDRSAKGDLGDGTRLADYAVEGGVKVFRLRMAPMALTVSPGVTKQAFAFNGAVPGPVIRVNEGDRVRMIVQNDLPVATAVHWHGMILPNDQDGVPHLTQDPIRPGQRYVYEWTAVATGTHWYHPHSSRRDIGRGLYGTLEVVPRAGDIRADRDYRLMIGDTNLGFVLNGRSFPATVPLKARMGERVRIRLIGTGEGSHPVHLHGFPFRVMAQDGLRLPQPQWMDTLLVSPGQTFDILVVPQTAGRWLLHCHIFAHSETDRGMKGLVTTLDVEKSSLPISPLDRGPV